MNNKENIINRNEKLKSSNSRKENSGMNHNFDRISAMNSPLTKNMLTEINVDNKINNIEKPVGCLIYKSIFNSLENNPNKDNINNITDNNINILKDKGKNFIFNLSNKKLNKNHKYSINLKKQIQNTKKESPKKNNDDIQYNMNDEFLNNINDEINEDIINNNDVILNNDIKYQKQYSSNINDNILSNGKNTEYSNIDETKKFLKYQKSEDNLNKNGILNKKEFMNKIKEINDLEFYEDNNNNKYSKKELPSEKELLSNNELLKEKNKILKKNHVYGENQLIRSNEKNLILSNNKNSSIAPNFKNRKNTFISAPAGGVASNNVLLTKNLYNNLTMNNLSNFENNINNKEQLGQMTSNSQFQKKKNNTYNLNIDFNTNSFYNKNLIRYYNNNYDISKELEEQNYFSTLSNVDNDRSHSNNKASKKLNNIIHKKNIDTFIQNKIQNYNKINNRINNFNSNYDDLTNEFSNSLGNNYNSILNKSNNISNASGNYYITEIQALKKELNQKKIIIDKFSEIVNGYKIKNNNLLDKIKQIQENSKLKQQSLLEQIKEYQKEIYTLKNNINLLNKKSEINNKNENYNINIYNYNDYIRQINELKEELEKYKKENNNLKILAIKYKYNNIKNDANFSQAYIDDTSRNRFKFCGGLEKKYTQKSFSVSKTKRKIRASSLSKKIFEEGDLDLHSDNNYVNSFILN